MLEIFTQKKPLCLSEIDYKIVESNKIRNVRLSISSSDGLIITVPKGFSRRKINNIFKEKRNWIEKYYQRVDEKKQQYPSYYDKGLPRKITLPAINEEHILLYRPTTAKSVKVKEEKGSIIVYGNIKDTEKTLQALQKWFYLKAKKVIPPLFKEYSDQYDFKFKNITIRNQKSRWGSCSSQNNISLNSKLLFIPKEYMEYIFLHELCHTIYLNHSPKFWALVKKIDPEYEGKNSLSKRELWYKYVPGWV